MATDSAVLTLALLEVLERTAESPEARRQAVARLKQMAGGAELSAAWDESKHSRADDGKFGSGGGGGREAPAEKSPGKKAPEAPPAAKKRASETLAAGLAEAGRAFAEGEIDAEEALARGEAAFESARGAVADRYDEMTSELMQRVNAELGLTDEQADVILSDYLDDLNTDSEFFAEQVSEALEAVYGAFADAVEEGEDPADALQEALAGMKPKLEKTAKEYVARLEQYRKMTGEAVEEAWSAQADEMFERLQSDYEDDPEGAAEDAELFNAELERSGNPYRLFKDDEGWGYDVPEEGEGVTLSRWLSTASPGGRRRASRGVELSAAGEWAPYQGPKGGKGWKNSASGEVLYQEERPGAKKPGVFGRLKSAAGLGEKSKGAGEGQKQFASPSESATVRAILSGEQQHELHHNAPGGKEDTALTAIMKESGRDTVPHVAPPGTIDKLAKEGWYVCYRGVGEEAHAEQFERGKELYNGAGMYGNGSYFAYVGKANSDPAARAVADKYAKGGRASGGAVTRMAFPPGAKIGDHETVKAERAKYESGLANERLAGKITKDDYEKLLGLVADLGRFAALHNYDAIRVPGDGYLCVLNRAKCVIEAKP